MVGGLVLVVVAEDEQGAAGRTVQQMHCCLENRHARTLRPGKRTSFRFGSISTISRRYLEWSITTATLQHCPARLVPPPRERTGAPCARQTSTVATTSSIDFGSTTPIGTCR